MKKTIYLLAILTITALLITACKSIDILDDQPAAQQTADDQPAAQQTQTQPAQTQQTDTGTQVSVPADTYTIKQTDSSDKFIMKYKIDPDNKWKVKTATFEMRNFGDEALTPKINFIIGTAGAVGELKTFEYDAIPPGYKMIKQETVNMDVGDEHVYIKGTLIDKDTNKDIDSVNFDYFAG